MNERWRLYTRHSQNGNRCKFAEDVWIDLHRLVQPNIAGSVAGLGGKRRISQQGQGQYQTGPQVTPSAPRPGVAEQRCEKHS